MSSPVRVYSFSLQLLDSFNLETYPGSGDEEGKKKNILWILCSLSKYIEISSNVFGKKLLPKRTQRSGCMFLAFQSKVCVNIRLILLLINLKPPRHTMTDSSNRTLSNIYHPSVGVWQKQPYSFSGFRMQSALLFKWWKCWNVVVYSNQCELYQASSQTCHSNWKKQIYQLNIIDYDGKSQLAGGRPVGYSQAWPRSWTRVCRETTPA